jgi:hypothetical protein
MKPLTFLRMMIAASWILLATGVVLELTLDSTLPPALQQWLAEEAAEDFTTVEVVAASVAFAALIALVVASIALARRRLWGRRLYLQATLALGVVPMFLGPTVTAGVASGFEDLALVASGLVLGTAYFSRALEPHDGLPDDLAGTFS